MTDPLIVRLPDRDGRSGNRQSVVDAIIAGELDEELPQLLHLIDARLTLLNATRSAMARANLTVGDRVLINHTVKPAYLHEQCGTIIEWHGSQAVVQLDAPIGRFRSGQIRCSPEALQKLA
jgi:hypothetical protein